MNSNTLSIISGNPNGTYLNFAYDMAVVLDNDDKLRVLPIVGRGAAQNMRDLLYLKGIDMGITQADILSYYKKSGEIGNIADRLRYITRLFNEELHVLVPKKIKKLEDLRGKKVNFSDAGSGTEMSGRLIFDALGIEVEPVNMGQDDAIEAMKRGEVEATILLGGKPAAAFAQLKPGALGLHLIGVPYAQALHEDYTPSAMAHNDYPALIPRGQVVETIAVGAVLAVFNWAPDSDHYRRVSKFTQALFTNFDHFLQPPRHEKWKEVNLAAELPGWKRFPAAQEMIDKRQITTTASTVMKDNFDQFIAGKAPDTEGLEMSDESRRALFREFMEWRKAKEAKK